MDRNSNAATRIPRVLFFTAGIVPTTDEYESAQRFGANVGMRNASLVGAMPHSPLEECDAVAGAVPSRYAAVYPDVSDFEGENMLRLSDLDRRHGRVTEVNNEAARAAKPPAVGDTLGMVQGAQRPAGATTMADGGFVAPLPARPDALPAFGSERAENAPQGGAGPSKFANPTGLPEGGATAFPEGTAPTVSTGVATEVGAKPNSSFAPPVPEKPEEDEEDDAAEINPETGRKYTKAQLKAKAKAEAEANA